MQKIHLFTDGSVNPQHKMGCGAYLATLDLKEASPVIHTQLFQNTSSTQLELKTLLWALDEIKISNQPIVIYTDSQNIISLLHRQEKLENNQYQSKNGKLLKNHQLYKTFYQKQQEYSFEIVKLQGHLPTAQKNQIDILFNQVDKASRKAMRKVINLL